MTMNSNSGHPSSYIDFVDLLMSRAQQQPDTLALSFLGDGDRVTQTRNYHELHQHCAANAVAFSDQLQPGDRVLILLDSSPEYIESFLGCFYAGLVAVPAYPPESRSHHHMTRLLSMLEDCEPSLIVISAAHKDLMEAVAEAYPEIVLPRILVIESVDIQRASDWRKAPLQPDTLAFLQYTSGSTSAPKGVMVSHRNLYANESVMQEGFHLIPQEDVILCWLPLFHDMGLMSGALLPIFVGCPLVLMSPKHFLERPARWLNAIHDFGATLSGGPDFAYRLCAERIRATQIRDVDLSRWRVAFSGSEPVRPDTLQGFEDAFSDYGFRHQALLPAYGQAETTLYVTGCDPEQDMLVVEFDPAALAEGRAVPLTNEQRASGVQGSSLVGCGTTRAGHTVAIFHDEINQELPPDTVGEICSAGDSNAEGYWKNPEATANLFFVQAGKQYLRSGDLGFLHQGQLFVAGRKKDLIIVRGQNHYPQDIELTVEEQVSAVRKGRVAAFSLVEDGEEVLAVAAEVGRAIQKKMTPEALFEEIRIAVANAHQLAVEVIVLLQPKGLPKTTSGKLQRSACQKAWAQDSFDSYAIFDHGSIWSSQDNRESQPQTASGSPAMTTAETQLAQLWHQVLQRKYPALALADITPRSHFFALGGDSLLAVQLRALIQEQWHKPVEPEVMFQQPVLAEMSQQIAALPVQQPSPQPSQPLLATGAQDGFPLSSAQRGLYFLNQLEQDKASYNVPVALELSGPVNAQALAQALNLLLQRHAVLRTQFISTDEGELRQRIRTDAALEWRHQQVSSAAEAEALGQQESHYRFDLENELLIRTLLVSHSHEQHTLYLTLHHIITDGWSMQILLRELTQVYNNALQQRPLEQGLTAVANAFPEFVWQQHQWLTSPDCQQQQTYWQQQLRPNIAALDLGFSHPRPAQLSAHGARYNFTLDADTRQALVTLAEQHNATLFMVMLTLFQSQLQQLSGQTDIRIGVPNANRARPEWADSLGFFVNTQVIRAQVQPDSDFGELLQRNKATLFDAQRNSDLPLDQVIEALQPARDLSMNPLFQVKFTQQLDLGDIQLADDVATRVRWVDDFASHFDLGLDITDTGQSIEAVMTYATDLFDEERVGQLAMQFASACTRVTSLSDQAVSRDLWLPEASTQTTSAQTTGSTEYPSVLAHWQQQLQQQGNALVVVDSHGHFTRQQIEALANRLAQQLLDQGVQRHDLVSLEVSRDVRFVIGLLACFKIGAAYLPLDASLPLQRRDHLSRTAGCRLRLSAGDIDLTPPNAAIVLPELASQPDDLAYVIFTSGSTGEPKGVQISQAALGHYVGAIHTRMALEPQARLASVSGISADLGNTLLFEALCHGHCLYLVDDQTARDPDAMADYMTRHRIDGLKITPSYLQGLLAAANPAQVLPSRLLMLGGESCSVGFARQLQALNPAPKLFNHYGPTETTVGAVCCDLSAWLKDSREPDEASVPLGLPLPGYQVELRDEHGQVAEHNGEIHIVGPALALGYLGQEEETTRCFPTSQQQRCYRTGDLARWNEQGLLVFIGRQDDQVKVRGYRVELDEVRRAIDTLDGVQQAHVLLTTGTSPQLAAFCCVQGGVQTDDLKQRLSEQLPDYMVPALWRVVRQLPKLASGKVDRKALLAELQQPAVSVPAIQASAAQTRAETAPETVKTEKTITDTLLSIWREVLAKDDLSTRDNFFEAGGDSILSLQIIARARKQGIKLTPKQLFQHQTIDTLVQALSPASGQPVQTQTQAQPGVGDVLLAIWAEVLGKTHLTPDDNFFEAGGDSILSLQIIARARKQGIKLTPKQLFQHQTVRSLEAILITANPAGATPAAPSAATHSGTNTASSSETVPLSPIQKRFFQRPVHNRNHWNQSVRLSLSGVKTPAATLLGTLKQALTGLIQRHPLLTAHFTEQPDGQWLQSIPPFAETGAESGQVISESLCELLNSSDESQILATANRLQRSLDIGQGRLLKGLLIAKESGTDTSANHMEMELIVIIHHLVIDGVSWRVVLDELQQHLNGQPLAVTRDEGFARWSQWLNRLDASHSWLQKASDYWQERLQAPSRTQLAGVSATVSEPMLQQAPLSQWQQAVTVSRSVCQNEQLLTALAHTLCEAPETLLIDIEGHGRFADDADIQAGLDNSLGWFTAICPWVLQRSSSLEDSLQHSRQQLARLREIDPQSYGVLHQLQGRIERPAAAQVLFNYLGQFNTDQALDGAGLSLQMNHQVSGTMRDPQTAPEHLLVINCYHSQGQLLCEWQYQTAALKPEQVERWARCFGEQLQALEQLATGTATSEVGVDGQSDTQWLCDVSATERERLPNPEQLQAVYPLSPLQQGMLFHCVYQTPDAATEATPQAAQPTYINQLQIDFTGLDVERFERCWQQLVDQHDMLRTGFYFEDFTRTPLQCVYRHASVPVTVLDWRDQPNDAEQWQTLLDHERQHIVLGMNVPLMRFALVRLDDQQTRCVWTRHHILMDGWSSANLFSRFLTLYQGQPLSADAVESDGARYRDYIAWLQQQDATAAETFWKQQLASLTEPGYLAPFLLQGAPQDYQEEPRAQISGDTSGQFTLNMPSSLSQRLKRRGRAMRVTLNTLMQAGWAILLHNYTRQAEVVMGVTVAGRPADLPELQQTIGLFINTLPINVVMDSDLALQGWLTQLQETNLAVREYEHSALFDIQRWAPSADSATGNALFDTLLVFENYPVDASLQPGADGLSFRLHDNSEPTSYALTLVIQEALNVGAGDASQHNDVQLRFSFDSSRFAATVIQSLARQYLHILQQLSQCDAEDPIPRAMSDVSDLAQVLTFSQGPRDDFDQLPGRCTSLIERIADQARITPEAPALAFEEQTLSYQQMMQQVDHLAAVLIAQGVQAEDLIGLCAHRSIEMVIALLAINRAGAAYVPLDPDLPDERLGYILETTRSLLVLTTGTLDTRLQRIATSRAITTRAESVTALLQIRPAASATAALSNIGIHPAQLAYVIFTSGSTGQPKGAANTHEALLNRVLWMQQAYALEPQDCVLQKTPFGFDVSVWEFFWPLVTGARLAIAPPDAHRQPQQLMALIEQHQVTTLHFVPSMLRAFVDWSADEMQDRQPSSLRRVLCSGEALPTGLQNAALALWPDSKLYNLYGPTEAAIDVTHWQCHHQSQGQVPIGQPIANTRIYVLDEELNPLPSGVAGELYIAGINLARGYHQRSGLTAERFIPDPFSKHGERMYRSGDLVRWRDDGVLEYLGRLDHQVKLRGQRIELEEIETVLAAHADVAAAAVAVKNLAGADQLIAYLVANPSGSDVAGDPVVNASDESATLPLPESVRAFLATRLPGYMVPSLSMILPALPLTASGKLDRKALPQPTLQDSATNEAPASELEGQLAAIWSEVLGLEVLTQEALASSGTTAETAPRTARIGRHSGFMALGGHSLLVVRVIARIQQQLQLSCSVAEFFDARTLADLATLLAGKQSSQLEDTETQQVDSLLAELEGL